MADRLEVIDTLQVVIDRLDASLADVAKIDPRVKVLTELPGIGPLTASASDHLFRGICGASPG